MTHWQYRETEIGGDFDYRLVGLTAGVSDSPNHQNLFGHYPSRVFTDSGRSALRYALSHIARCEPGDRVLLPGYLCDSVMQACLAVGASADFYPVDRSFRPALSDVCGRYKAAVAIAFFGFSVSAGDIAALRQLAETVIIDRSHNWLSVDPVIGADVEVASLRKVIGLPDGGVVLSQSEGPPLNRGESPSVAVRVAAAMLKHAYLEGHLTEKLHLPVFHAAEELWDRATEIFPMSRYSHSLLSGCDLGEIRRRRQDNYDCLASFDWALAGSTPVFPRRAHATTPLGFPIYTVNRNALRARLIANGIFPPVHWPVPPGITLPGEAAWMAQHILTIPTDQRYMVEDMERVLWVVGGAGGES